MDRVLIASYSRRVLKQTGSGHFSPIAAYDEASDTVLIMDTVRLFVRLAHYRITCVLLHSYGSLEFFGNTGSIQVRSALDQGAFAV